MKPHFFKIILIFTFILLNLYNCSDKQDDTPPFLTIEKKTVNFNASAYVTEVTVKSNSSNWSASVQADATSWLEATPRGGVLVIVVTENGNFGSR